MKNGRFTLASGVEISDDDLVRLVDLVYEELKDSPLLNAAMFGKRCDAQGKIFSLPENEANGLFARIEAAFVEILNIYTWGRDRNFLLKSAEALARKLAAFPAEDVRPLLRVTSQQVDALLLFTGLWGTPGYRDVLALADGKKRGDGYGEQFSNRFAVPFVSFLLAWTDFPFTEEEYANIAAGNGIRLSDIVKRPDERPWECGVPVIGDDACASKSEGKC